MKIKPFKDFNEVAARSPEAIEKMKAGSAKGAAKRREKGYQATKKALMAKGNPTKGEMNKAAKQFNKLSGGQQTGASLRAMWVRKGQLSEAVKTKKATFTFGRFNPFHQGHGKLIKRLLELAKGGDHFVFPSLSQDPKRNPLPHKAKVAGMRKAFPRVNIVDNAAMKNPFIAAGWLAEKGYTDITIVVGDDRLAEMKKIGVWLTKKEPNVKFKAVSAGGRDPDSEGTGEMSATKMRGYATDNDIKKFSLGVPRGMSTADTKKLFTALRKGMKLESFLGEVMNLTLGDLFRTLKSGDTVWSYDSKNGRLATGNYPSASHDALNMKLLKQGRYSIKGEDAIEDFYSETFVNGYQVDRTMYIYDMFINDKIVAVPKEIMRSIERKLKPVKVVRLEIHESISEAYKRDYRKEYDNYHGTPVQRLRNASRKRARRAMERAGKCKPFDKKDVHHKNHDAMNNTKSNLAVTDIATNRADNQGMVHGDRVDHVEGCLIPFTNYKKRLDEKLLLINNGKRNGQIVFLAGGAGSGKGFAIANFLEKEKFKVRDVDEWKRAFIEIDKIKKNHPEIRNLDLRKPEDVVKMHIFIKTKGIKSKTLDLLLNDKRKENLPNILFDTTFKVIFEASTIIKKLVEVGYEPKNIHIVWVLADYKIALKRNASRSRVVPEDILLDTHVGAARTMWDLSRGKHNPKGYNGGMYVILSNGENTIFYADPKTGKPLNGRDGRATVIKDFKYLTLKLPGKPRIKDKAVKAEVLSWIQANAPRHDKLSDIFKAEPA